jgi:hypothetical protein
MQQRIRVLCFLSPLFLLTASGSTGLAQNGYTPQPQFCADGTASLCPIIPGDIGPDPALALFGYQGLIGKHPASAKTDVQTPFDNLSWQTFVALNWTAGKQSAPPEQGLQSAGARVWQTWARPADVFHSTSTQANCSSVRVDDEPVFSFASNGKGKELPTHEEIIQAATGDPLIDIEGNWTLYERRLNPIEITYLQAPGGNKDWNLTTIAGQQAFLTASPPQKVTFPDFKATNASVPSTGAIEIKAAWRVLDLKKHPDDAKRFYVIHALLAVAPDLVKPAGKLCAQVDLGLVAMHIIQKNVPQGNNLLASWFWTTFEHVDNAPMAANPCDVTDPLKCELGTVKDKPELQSCPPPPPPLPPGTPEYSYFTKNLPPGAVNVPPTASPAGKFLWSRERPFAANYLKPVGGKKIGTQVARCWGIYETTAALNTQWRDALAKVGSVFSHYMLVSTQWGTTYETLMKLPEDAAPNLLSNTVVETYMQRAYDSGNGFNTGSCVSCHSVATFNNSTVPTDFSFLPGSVKPELRRPPLFQPPH